MGEFPPHHPAYVAQLAQQLAALELLEYRNRNMNANNSAYNKVLVHPYHRDIAPVHIVPPGLYPVETVRRSYNGFHWYGSAQGSQRAVSLPPVHHTGLLNPVQSQFETFMATRARILMRQQNRLNQMLPSQTFPTNKSGLDLGANDNDFSTIKSGLEITANSNGIIREASSSSQKKLSGTGVFIPCKVAKKRQGGKRGGDKIKAAYVSKGEESSCLPPDICLPQEWTY